MSKQKGPCAFTAACIFPPRFRLRGTNREICVVHARSFVLAQVSQGVAGRSAGQGPLAATAAPGPLSERPLWGAAKK